MCILIIAFPMSVAPKNVQNGTRKWPHVMPARSKRGLGIWKKKEKWKVNIRNTTQSVKESRIGLLTEAQSRIPKKPARRTRLWTETFTFWTKLWKEETSKSFNETRLSVRMTQQIPDWPVSCSDSPPVAPQSPLPPRPSDPTTGLRAPWSKAEVLQEQCPHPAKRSKVRWKIIGSTSASERGEWKFLTYPHKCFPSHFTHDRPHCDLVIASFRNWTLDSEMRRTRKTFTGTQSENIGKR